nr:nicotinate-nucleotide--dimethylbenzimidazole phosphoribosyltransferase [Deltaproteobacteria bacterium]
QHTATPRADRRTIVVCAGDHGAGDPGISLGASHPTVIAAHAIASGSAALADVARASRTPIMLVDAGAVEGSALPAATIRLGRGPTRDLLREPAMTVVDATLGLEAGIALAVSLSESGLDVLALGALGVGSELAAAAVLGAAGGPTLGAAMHPAPMQGALDGLSDAPTRASAAPVAIGTDPGFPLDDDRGVARDLAITPDYPLVSEPGLDARTAAGSDADPGLVLAWQQGRTSGASGGLDLLATFGGPETAVLAGLILGAASLHIPVILDGHATGVAALIAVRLAPDAAGYLIAAHAGSTLQGSLLALLGLEPAFAVGLGHGEGIGAAMVLPLLDQVVALATTR